MRIKEKFKLGSFFASSYRRMLKTRVLCNDPLGDISKISWTW